MANTERSYTSAESYATAPLNKARRFEILRRDGFRCRYCGASATAPGVILHIDHVLPRSEGGTDAPENLITACAACNSGKGATTKAPKPKQPLQVCLDADLLEKARDAVFVTPGLTLTALVSDALQMAIEQLAAQRGEPIPKRKKALKVGRPIGGKHGR